MWKANLGVMSCWNLWKFFTFKLLLVLIRIALGKKQEESEEEVLKLASYMPLVVCQVMTDAGAAEF